MGGAVYTWRIKSSGLSKWENSRRMYFKTAGKPDKIVLKSDRCSC